MTNIRAYTWFFWFTAVFFAVGIVFWFIPRDILDLQITTEKTSYNAGDTILTTNQFESYGQANSEYDVSLVCRNGVERRVKLLNVRAVSEPKPRSQSKAEYKIPGYVQPGHNCVIAVNSSHEVSVLPFLSKTIYDRFESNQFVIEE